MAEQESWYERYPDYRVDLSTGATPMKAVFNGAEVAASERPLIVAETNHEPVVYFPLEDVRLEFFAATDHHTFCPFKGEASYWTLDVNGETAENVLWAYPEPLPEVAGLKGFAAFYSDRVTITEANEAP